jgi:hypothetical protein
MILVGKTKVLGEIPVQIQFYPKEFHMAWVGMEPGLSGWETGSWVPQQ